MSHGGAIPAAIPIHRFTTCRCSSTALPPYPGREEIRECERLYLDTIAAARRYLYLENQYLTSRSVCQALCRSLETPRGPDLIIVLPRETGQWLEQHTMDFLRSRTLSRLRDADRYGRLRVYHPDVTGLAQGCLMVHAKLVIADDRVLRCLATLLGLSTAERSRQIESLARRIDRFVDLAQPLILLGDFNEWWPWTRRLAPIDARLRAVSRRRTWPATVPLLGLDRLWYAGPIELLGAAVVFTPVACRASDHLPLLARMHLAVSGAVESSAEAAVTV